MNKPNDRGGAPYEGPIDRSEHELEEWERRVDALTNLLGQKGLRAVDESRRQMEDIAPGQYESLAYYERWTVSLEKSLIEKRILTREEIDRKAAELAQRWRQP